MSAEEITDRFGSRVVDFEDGSDNYYALGNDVAEVTDDASQTYEMARAVAECKGRLTVDAAAQALVRWSESYPKYYPRNAGPTDLPGHRGAARGGRSRGTRHARQAL